MRGANVSFVQGRLLGLVNCCFQDPDSLLGTLQRGKWTITPGGVWFCQFTGPVVVTAGGDEKIGFFIFKGIVLPCLTSKEAALAVDRELTEYQ